jgi:hypothetical protein
MLKEKILSHKLKYGFSQDIGYVGSPQVGIAKVWKIEDLQTQVIDFVLYLLLS